MSRAAIVGTMLGRALAGLALAWVFLLVFSDAPQWASALVFVTVFYSGKGAL